MTKHLRRPEPTRHSEKSIHLQPSWGQQFNGDGFGNLTNTAVIQGSAPSMTASYDYNNHAGGEDANGNPGYVPDPAFGSLGPAASMPRTAS